MAHQPLLAVMVMENRSGLAKDRIVNTFALDDVAGPPAVDVGGAVTSAFQAFYLALVPYLSFEADLNTFRMEYYDLTGHLDGSAHGSPFNIVSVGGFGGTVIQGIPQGCCCLIQWRATDTVDPVVGPSGLIPTDREGQREGAPATHVGRTRPRSRSMGRSYVGPLNVNTLDSLGAPSYRTILKSAVKTAIATAANHLLVSLITAGTPMAIWSRRNAAMKQITSGAVLDKFAYQRGREIHQGPSAPFTSSP